MRTWTTSLFSFIRPTYTHRGASLQQTPVTGLICLLSALTVPEISSERFSSIILRRLRACHDLDPVSFLPFLPSPRASHLPHLPYFVLRLPSPDYRYRVPFRPLTFVYNDSKTTDLSFHCNDTMSLVDQLQAISADLLDIQLQATSLGNGGISLSHSAYAF